MAFLLFIILTISEIGFTVFELTKKSSKKEWSLKRLIANAAELAVFFLALLLPGIDLSFRFKALLFILFARIAISGIVFLIKRKNEKDKSKAMIVLSALLSVMLIATNMIPAFVFTDYSGRPLTGKYTVKEAEAILIDNSRIEEFETDNSKREIPVHFYCPKELTESGNSIDSLPLVIFSHGAFGYYKSNASTYMKLASHGYVVVSLDHPYHSFFTKDSSGRLITVNPDFISTALYIGGDEETGLTEEERWEITSEWINLRVEDVNFVIDTLKNAADGDFGDAWAFTTDSKEEISKITDTIDTEKIGLIGHSLGGATAVTVGRREDVKAVIDLDGTMLGEETGASGDTVFYNEEAYTTPLLSIDKEDHYKDRIYLDSNGYNYVNNVILKEATEGYSTYFVRSEHMNFTDLPLFSPFLAKMLGTGDIDAGECIDKVNAIVLSFFDCYLKGEGDFTVLESY
ncbi:MAG: hypothetical protein K6G75_10475 [Lachnospiraceae bacterium]|nr:hypothetical protein [Lachnospiraceae bacterium]